MGFETHHGSQLLRHFHGRTEEFDAGGQRPRVASGDHRQETRCTIQCRLRLPTKRVEMLRNGSMAIRNVTSSRANLRNVVQPGIRELRTELRFCGRLPFDAIEAMLPRSDDRVVNRSGMAPQRFEEEQFHYKGRSLVAMRKPRLSRRQSAGRPSRQALRNSRGK